jgi:peptidoglycan/xylan/chitin deacetylase (PgdA/CDA1 family)
MSTPFVLTLIATATLLAAGIAGVYYAAYAVRSQWLGRTEFKGRTDAGAVALTFDDGPSPFTEHVLDILAAHNLRATFFMIGRHVELFPQTAKRIVAEGHEIGNHSYSHPIYLYRSPRETRQQLTRAQAIIAATTGVSPKLARPPCGVRTPAYFQATRELGLRTVQWDVTGFDWKRRSGERIARAVVRKARAGSIILLHDGDSEGKQDRLQTVAALPLIIEGIRARGLRIVSLTHLLGEKELELAA